MYGFNVHTIHIEEVKFVALGVEMTFFAGEDLIEGTFVLGKIIRVVEEVISQCD